jgi:hypothetical protein
LRAPVAPMQEFVCDLGQHREVLGVGEIRQQRDLTPGDMPMAGLIFASYSRMMPWPTTKAWQSEDCDDSSPERYVRPITDMLGGPCQMGDVLLPKR